MRARYQRDIFGLAIARRLFSDFSVDTFRELERSERECWAGADRRGRSPNPQTRAPPRQCERSGFTTTSSARTVSLIC